MKFFLGLLLFTVNTVSVSSTISGDISDMTLCGESLIETSCEFEADPDRRRLVGNRIRNRRNRRRNLNGKGKETEPPGADGFLNFCTVLIDGTEVESEIEELVYTEVTFDEEIKGDDVKLELFASLIKLTDDSGIVGLVKLETFEYEKPDAESDDDPLTTLKTFSIF